MFSPFYSLYRPPSVLQPPPGAGPSSLDPSFRAYKATLTQRLEGKAAQLHEALTTLEDAAASLQKDLSRMFADGENSQYVATTAPLVRVLHLLLQEIGRISYRSIPSRSASIVCQGGVSTQSVFRGAHG